MKYLNVAGRILFFFLCLKIMARFMLVGECPSPLNTPSRMESQMKRLVELEIEEVRAMIIFIPGRATS